MQQNWPLSIIDIMSLQAIQVPTFMYVHVKELKKYYGNQEEFHSEMDEELSESEETTIKRKAKLLKKIQW